MTALIDLFCSLAKIPSPSLEEENVAREITSFFEKNGIKTRRDAYGNVYAEVPASDKSKHPLMLSAHMDVVGDTSPVNIVFSEDGKIIETDKKRTLGADDKAGVAAAMWLAKTVNEDKSLAHGGLEIVFTRDEEQNMSGAHAVEFSTLKSEYILVLDGDRLGDFQIAGAGFTKMLLSVNAFKGGHSGIDIADSARVNAVKLLADIMAVIPQGVYKQDETGVITSINAGAVIGGGIKNIASDKQGTGFCRYMADNAMSNIINTDAFALYSIRSSDRQAEASLTKEIEEKIAAFNREYAGKASFSAKFEEHAPAFEKSEDETMIETARKAAEKLGITLNVSSFHAGAETHIYSHKQNASGKTFKPYLVGAADIYDMHSSNERMSADSLNKGFELIRAVFKTFNGI